MGRKRSDPVKMRPARWTGTPPAGKGWACNILIRKGGGLCPQKEGKTVTPGAGGGTDAGQADQKKPRTFSCAAKSGRQNLPANLFENTNRK